VEYTEEMRNAYKILFGKSEERRQVKKPRSRLEDIIKMHLAKIGRETRNCFSSLVTVFIKLADVHTILHLRASSYVGNFLIC
jgi:hypothetical protein